MQLSELRLIIPVILITMVLIGLAHYIGKNIDFYRRLVDSEISSTRFHAIDGLRGLVAISVMFHHSVIMYFYYVIGRWESPPSTTATLMGQGGVAIFFMITAFLFWYRALQNNGQINFRRFFNARVFRLAPLFGFSALMVIMSALIATEFHIANPLQVLKQAAAWLSFGFLGSPVINGYVETPFINTVFWTLRYEWGFYLLFPFIMYFSKGWRSIPFLAASGFILAHYSKNTVAWYFLYGILSAILIFKFPTLKKLTKTPAASLALIAIIVCTPLYMHTAYDSTKAPIIFFIFLLISGGNTLFGFLTSRAMRLLGTLSYSVYLFHNFVLYWLFKAVNRWIEIKTLSLPSYWILVAISAVLTVGVSAITYRWIEYPFLRKTLYGGAKTSSAQGAG